MASGLLGNSARDLRERSSAESALYLSARALDETPATLWLLDPPPMGWTNSEADAENVVSTARRRGVSVLFAETITQLPPDAPALEYREGEWQTVVRED